MSVDMVQRLADEVGVEGTGRGVPFTPMFPFLVRLLPCTVRSFLRLRFTGLERVPKRGAVIIAGNHTSHVDPLIEIIGVRRPLRFLSKKEHFSVPGIRQVMLWTGQLETDRQAGASDALARASDILSAGSPMGLFPEGTRSRSQEAPYLQRGKTGVARLAATFPDMPVHPVALAGARDMLAPGSSRFRPFARIDIHVGESITWREWLRHPRGGAFDDEKISSILAASEEERRASMSKLYRSFTDQFIESLRALGAP